MGLEERRECALNARLNDDEMTHVFHLTLALVHVIGDGANLGQTQVQVVGLFAARVSPQLCQQQIVA